MKKRYQTSRSRIRKAVAVVTAAGMAVCTAAVPAAGEDALNTEKEETVYVFTDASGNQKSLLVSDWLRNSGALGTITDCSNLRDIENVKGDEIFTQNGSAITWNASGNDIYYQGQTDAQPPVDVKITYILDGKEMSPRELGGASGHLKIRYDYTNHEERTVTVDGKKESVYVPFGVISGCLFTDGCASNVRVSSGKVLDEGGNVAVVGLAFPGLKDSLKLDQNKDLKMEKLDLPDYVEIEADVENFSMDMNLSLVLDDALDEVFEQFDSKSDLNQIKDDIDKLETASSELVEGSGDLYEGMTELDEGAGDLDEGVKKYTEGVQKADKGAQDLKEGTGKLAQGAEELASGAGTLSDGTDTLDNNTGALTGGADDLYKGVKAVRSAVAKIAGGMKSLSKGAGKLASGAESLSKGTNTVSDAVKSADTGAGRLKEGADAVDTGVGQISDAVSGNQELASLNTEESRQKLAAVSGQFDALQKGLDMLSADPSLLIYDLADSDNRMDALITVAKLNGSQIDKETLINCIAAAKLSGDSSLQTKLLQVILTNHPDVQQALIEKILAEQTVSSAEDTVSDTGTYAGDYPENTAESGGSSDESQASAVSSEEESADTVSAAAAEPSQTVSQPAQMQAETGAAIQEDTATAAVPEETAPAEVPTADTESIAAAKETAAAQMQQAESEAGDAAGSVSSAQSSKQTADSEGSSASSSYQAAYDQYAPDVNNLIAAMQMTPLTAEAGSISSIVNQAQTVAGSFQQAQADYQAASGSYESAASSYEAAIASYKEVISTYEGILELYQEALDSQSAYIQENAQQQSAQSETAAPVTAVPETSVPETVALETPVPETAAQEASAPETASQPETAPDLSSAPEEALNTSEMDPARIQALIWQYLSTHPEEAEAILRQAAPEDLAAAGVTSAITAEDVDRGLVYMLTAAGQQAGMSQEAAAAQAQTTAQTLIDGTQQAVTQLQSNKSMLMGMAGINSDQELSAEDAAQKMSEGKGTVSNLQDLVKLAQGVREAFFGEKGLVSALTSLRTGTGSLSSGASALSEGLNTLNQGMPSLTGGAAEVSGGASALNEGAAELDRGTSELDKNMPALKKGSKALSDGAKTVANAIAKIASGAGTLAKGAGSLKDGSRELDSGADALKSGLDTLDGNSSQLTEGTSSLKEGTKQLAEGTKTLADGMAEFNEEGISKIVDLFEGDLTVLLDRMEALKDAGEGYNSFSGLAEGMDGSVKFVIRSDSISAE